MQDAAKQVAKESHVSTKPKPTTIKLVPPEERDAWNAAARRRGVPLGQWLIEAGRQHIAQERISRVGSDTAPSDASHRPQRDAEAQQPPGAPMPVPELAALMRELSCLEGLARCGMVRARLRKLLAVELQRRIEASALSPPTLALTADHAHAD